MLECEKCNWFQSECNISCSLLTTVTSNICQYLHQYWLFLWRFFWHVPIRHRGRDLECQTANSMDQSATNEIGVLTVHHSEQPYLCQNKIFLCHIFGFWFLMIIECHSGFLEANCPGDSKEWDSLLMKLADECCRFCRWCFSSIVSHGTWMYIAQLPGLTSIGALESVQFKHVFC